MLRIEGSFTVGIVRRGLARDAGRIGGSTGEISRGFCLLLVIVLGQLIQACRGVTRLPIVLGRGLLCSGIRLLRARNVVLGRFRVLRRLRLRRLLLLRGSWLWRRVRSRRLWLLRGGKGNRKGTRPAQVAGQCLGNMFAQLIFDHIFGI